MRDLTPADKLWAFRKATNSSGGSRDRWAARARTGMTEEQLAKALEQELGIVGGEWGPASMCLSYAGAGLRIWASWGWVNPHTDKPLFRGRETIKAAREVYGIADPEAAQRPLFVGEKAYLR
jgi:hypothetical protein